MLEKNYNPKDFEEKIYAKWENNGDFKPDMRSDKDAFAIVIPPPKKFYGNRAPTMPVLLPKWWLKNSLPKRAFRVMIWDVKSLLKQYGNGANIRAAPFVSSYVVWALRAIGAESALPWMRDCHARCARFLYRYTKMG